MTAEEKADAFRRLKRWVERLNRANAKRISRLRAELDSLREPPPPRMKIEIMAR